MKRDTLIQIIAATIMVTCLTASGFFAVRLTASGGRNRLGYTDTLTEGQPPQVAMGIAMGAFRGLFVNALWIRANNLKEEGRFYESMDLARVITKLQPRFPQVWVFHAWNMAYNISVATQTPDERWGWVNAGIHLLREKGIPANPNDMVLHKELSWIFLHKIGGYTDDANQHYKRRLAQEWTIVLGPPPPRDAKDRGRSAAIEKHKAWLREIADAPGTLREAEEKQPGVAALAERIARDIPDLGLGEHLLTRWEILRHVRRSGRAAYLEQGLIGRSKALIPIYDDPAFAGAWPVLIAHLRKRLLVDGYKMEPERMIRYTEKYGPIDWRTPASHSLYWAARGVENSLRRWNLENKTDYDFTNTDRQVAHSVQELFRHGEVYFDFIAGMKGDPAATLIVMPNPHFVQTYGDILQEIRDRSFFEDTSKRIYTSLSEGYKNFLRESIAFFYARGERGEAQKWFDTLRRDPNKNSNNPLFTDRTLNLPLDEFAMAEVADRFTSPSVAVEQVTGTLMGAYASGLLGDDDELFRGLFEFAKRAHRYFLSEQARTTPAGGELYRMGFLDPDFGTHSGIVFFQFMQGLSLDEAATVYRNAPEMLRLYAYRALEARYRVELEGQARSGGQSFDVLFPRPGDQESFDREMARKAADRAPGTNIEQK